MAERMTIDRFEGDVAVCEVGVGVFADVPRARLPIEAREGSVVVEHNGKWELDEEAAEERKKRIQQKAERLFNR